MEYKWDFMGKSCFQQTYPQADREVKRVKTETNKGLHRIINMLEL